ncbi:MAG: N-acetylglutaminylglutamine amidotransferase [Zoogloeaceae bacterium]|jgi:asparagine synthase (glutamine-hydrolysing)|nr:N-acetylglutaminylglutamine amidotransferase [Zoogloeaceae bacterium]
MCGICGELRFDGGEPDLAGLRRMMARLAQRGPDDEGVYADGPLAFGHRRLAIIDLSAHSHQPMVDKELGLSMVFNGTIYNYRELRRELAGLGYHFFSEGDAEVILKAYHAWGAACVERFNGMFAFALWNETERSLFLGRDRTGIKPLYYTQDGQRFRFASALPALLAAGGVDTALDPVALHHHLTLHAVVPAPRTILKGVRKLAPAQTLTIDVRGRAQTHSYWRLSAKRPATPLGESAWLARVRESLVAAVERQQTAADVPVGVLLSGGLDSSLLVGLLHELGHRDVQTFSIGFGDKGDESGNEFIYSDAVAERFKTRHRKYMIPDAEVLAALPEVVGQMAEPMVSQDVAAFYLLAQRVAQSVKVVLSGQGADEVFAGYFWYPKMDAETGTPLEKFSRHYFDRDHAEYLATVGEAYAVDDVTGALVAARLAEPDADSFLDQVLRFDATTLIVDDPVKRVDNMTMAWGLEARVPFLDHELIELAMTMPPELKLREGGKWPLKAIARGLIPDSVIDRPKGYFPVPAFKYPQGAFLDFMRGVLDSDACHQRRLFRREIVDKLLAAPMNHYTRLQGAKVWHLALLEYWLQRHVDGL